jgi:hypothetical protein
VLLSEFEESKSVLVKGKPKKPIKLREKPAELRESRAEEIGVCSL